MVISTVYELQSFVAAIAMGVVVGIIYDIARSMRRVFLKDAISDIFMWTAIAISSVIIWYRFQNGEVRWYMFVGAFMSGVLYFLLISRVAFCAFYFLVKKIYLFLCLIFKLLLTPIKFLCKIVCVYIKKAKTKFSKKVEDKDYEEKACV